LATLRTTIPRSIKGQWEVKDGNKLDWKRNVMMLKMVLIITKIA